ncbi:MAG TPA: SBBP repeat-containing protein, partial [Planctomycetota bacterium]|nr:SBBP repeat-containing protein [Planctomycetota bacterium]
MRVLPLRLFASIAGLCAAAAAQIPFHFEPGPAGAFVARQPGLQIRVDGSGAELALPEGRRLAVRLAGGTAGASAERPLPGRSHYLIGNDPAAWRHDVPHSAQVRCASAWPGIDVVWYCRDGALEYDLVVAPGARAERAAITFAGADGVALRSDGSVVLTMGEHELVQRPPYAFQVVGGERREVRIDVQLERDTVTFRPIGHDATRELVIDPQIAYGTYLGGTGADAVHAIALDAAGNVYLTGLTTSANFPVASPAQPAIAGLYDVFVTKLDPTGTTILWSTFLGGNSGGFGIDEWPVALAVGPIGEVVVLGRTESTNFPTVNAVQPTLAGNVDAFVFSLAPSGSQLLWSTYLGGSGYEIDGDSQIGAGGGGVVIDAAGNAFVAGMTRSPNFPTANAVHPAPLGNSDLFIARFDAAGQRLYASYFGGSGFDDLSAANPSEPGRALLCGTSSGGFPTTPGVWDPSGDGGFAANVDVQAQALVWSTTFPVGIADAALDPAGNVYVVGTTSLGSVPTTMGAHQPDHGGSIQSHPWQAFAAKLTAGASSLAWCTYWGTPTDNESFSDVAVDAFGHAYAFGTTTEHFGTPSQSSLLVKFNTEGSSVVYSLEVAGRNSTGRDVTVALPGTVWVAGETWATGVATPGALQTVHGGNRDGFVARIVDAAASLRGFELPVDRLTSSDARIGTVTLDGGAPAGGAFVTLTSSSPDVVVPASVFVPAGSATALVPVTSSRVQGTQLAVFTATWNGTVKMTKARLWPGPWFR